MDRHRNKSGGTALPPGGWWGINSFLFGGDSMVMKKLSVPLTQFEDNTSKTGFLVGVAVVTFKADDPSENPHDVPKLTLKDKTTGEVFSVLLGAAAKDAISLLTLGAFTQVDRGKASGKGKAVPYTISQDTEDMDPAGK